MLYEAPRTERIGVKLQDSSEVKGLFFFLPPPSEMPFWASINVSSAVFVPSAAANAAAPSSPIAFRRMLSSCSGVPFCLSTAARWPAPAGPCGAGRAAVKGGQRR